MTGSETTKVLAVAAPMGLDTFGVAVALGLAGLPREHRLRVSVLFASFEAAMPLIGVAAGRPLGVVLGGAADYVAATLIVALGLYVLLSGDEEHDRLRLLTRRGLIGAAALGVSISLDELAIGFSAGLLRLPVPALVVVVSVQAFVVTQVGLRLGGRLSAAARGAAEKLSGVALLLLGTILLATQLSA